MVSLLRFNPGSSCATARSVRRSVARVVVAELGSTGQGSSKSSKRAVCVSVSHHVSRRVELGTVRSLRGPAGSPVRSSLSSTVVSRRAS